MNKIKIQTRLNNDLSLESESEYFFDDQFSVPFDANLKEENNNISADMSLDINKNMTQLCQSFSESCIYSDLDSSYQAFPDILDDYLDKRISNKDILFSPPQSGYDMEIKDSMIRSSISQSSLLKELLSKQSSRDYRITFEEKCNSNMNKKTFSSLINCSTSINDNDKTNCNIVTWNQIKNKNRNSLLKFKANEKVVEGNSTTWRQLKDNAANKVISWNKLKNASKTGDNSLLQKVEETKSKSTVNQRGRSATKFNSSVVENELGDSYSTNNSNNNVVKYRAHSEPRKSHRFSGTLLEIYSRTRGLNNQSKNSQDFLDLYETNINNIINKKNKTLINFGAQFPPISNVDYHIRQRSNSLLEKKPQLYPGLGMMKTPKSSRLTHSAFLSKTLPDLSFLNKSGDVKKLKSSKVDSGFESGSSNNDKLKDSNQFCSKCLSTFYEPAVTDDLIRLDDKNESHKSSASNHHRSVPNFQSADLLTGSPMIQGSGSRCRAEQECLENEMPLKSCLRQSLDRSMSEPDFGNSKLPDNIKYSDFGGGNNTESASSSVSDLEGIKTNKAKKSVSFSEKILKKPLSPMKYYGSSISLWRNDLNSSMKPHAIPRDWGLYGNGSSNVMVSEFVLGAQFKTSGSKEYELSNEDMKYKVMIRDIIKAVQETIANCSEQTTQNRNLVELKSVKTPLFIVDPLYALLTDGILPYQKNIMSVKSRYRLWNVVESSCNNIENMTDIMKSVTKVPITNEKNRFKVFISHLINAKLLQKWFKELVNNDSVLKNNYSKDSFLRQANTSLKGLYADLDTNLQLIDSHSTNSNIVKSRANVVKEKSATLKPTTSVKSLKKSNMNQFSTFNNPSSKFQESGKLKTNSQAETASVAATTGTASANTTGTSEAKSSRTLSSSIPLKSKSSNAISSSSASSTPLKKPVIYYPKYMVGKGKL